MTKNGLPDQYRPENGRRCLISSPLSPGHPADRRGRFLLDLWRYLILMFSINDRKFIRFVGY